MPAPAVPRAGACCRSGAVKLREPGVRHGPEIAAVRIEAEHPLAELEPIGLVHVEIRGRAVAIDVAQQDRDVCRRVKRHVVQHVQAKRILIVHVPQRPRVVGQRVERDKHDQRVVAGPRQIHAQAADVEVRLIVVDVNLAEAAVAAVAAHCRRAAVRVEVEVVACVVRRAADADHRRARGEANARQRRRAARGNRHGPVLARVVVDVGLGVADAAEVDRQVERPRRDARVVHPLAALVPHFVVSVVRPRIERGRNENTVAALERRARGIERDRHGVAIPRHGRRELDRLVRARAVRDVHAPVRAVVVVPHGTAVVEARVDDLASAGRIVPVLPRPAVVRHDGVGRHDTLPAVVAHVDADRARVGQHAAVRHVRDLHRVAAVRRGGTEAHDGRDVARGNGFRPAVAAVVVVGRAAAEHHLRRRRAGGDAAGVDPQAAGGAAHRVLVRRRVRAVVDHQRERARVAQAPAGRVVRDRQLRARAAVGHGRRERHRHHVARVILAHVDVKDVAAVRVALRVHGLDEVVDQNLALARDAARILLRAARRVRHDVVRALHGRVPRVGHRNRAPRTDPGAAGVGLVFARSQRIQTVVVRAVAKPHVAQAADVVDVAPDVKVGRCRRGLVPHPSAGIVRIALGREHAGPLRVGSGVPIDHLVRLLHRAIAGARHVAVPRIRAVEVPVPVAGRLAVEIPVPRARGVVADPPLHVVHVRAQPEVAVLEGVGEDDAVLRGDEDGPRPPVRVLPVDVRRGEPFLEVRRAAIDPDPGTRLHVDHLVRVRRPLLEVVLHAREVEIVVVIAHVEEQIVLPVPRVGILHAVVVPVAVAQDQHRVV